MIIDDKNNPIINKEIKLKLCPSSSLFIKTSIRPKKIKKAMFSLNNMENRRLHIELINKIEEAHNPVTSDSFLFSIR
ncbi:MAG: hypothetical protein ACTSQY_09995 [Candidatus Odinarchaeia archaeon]